MCGICGFLLRDNRFDRESLHSVALRMADTLKHRGPDDSGVWLDVEVGAALAHRRLSIQDLSVAGRQPMVSESGRFVIVYNGEIYNFPSLRHELENHGHVFRGHSDTEVLLAAISEWGVRDALKRMNGMFAFGLWDREEQTLTLVRDRVGKKPLYYGWCGEGFVFGSELKALRAHPDFDPEIDRDALGLFIQYAWVPSPYSIYKHVRKLSPGTLLIVGAKSAPQNASIQTYWSARDAAEGGERHSFSGSFEDATDELEALLRDAVRGRMIADVSLGALLSGGVDSSLIVSLMQELSSRPVKTFSIGFRESKYNEAEHALNIATYLGTDHTELYVTSADAMKVIHELPDIYDEPFADASQIPTFIVSRLARGGVTVGLSGDGGDELFAGYNRYFRCLRLWNKWGRFPVPLRRGVANIMGVLGRQGWQMLWAMSASGPREANKWRWYPAKLEQRAVQLLASNQTELFARMRSRCERGSDFIIGAEFAPTAFTDPSGWGDIINPLQAMMYLDFIGFMSDDILVKVDRASMSVSLEIRCPILDYRVVEFAWSLPISMRVGSDGGKRILREILARYVPPRLTARPKHGFSVPVGDWLRGPLHEWAEDLLGGTRLRQQGFFHAEAVRKVWQQHLLGWRNQSDLLWSILMFQAWYDAWMNIDRPVMAASAKG